MSAQIRTALFAAALLAATVGGTAAAATHASDDPNTRVVGGDVVSTMGRNPGAVSLYAPSYKGFSCSAERIGARWVMTARHCAELKPSRVYTNSLRHTTGDFANVKRTIYAPSGDMALLELDSAPAGPIMPWSDVAPSRGESVRFYGWGMTSSSARSSVLKTGTGTFSKQATNPFYNGTDLVFTGLDGAPWKGDSGGPVLDKQGRLIGTCSWSSSYGTSIKAQFGYTSTAAYAKWIQSTTGIAPGTVNQPNPTPTPDPTETPEPEPTTTPAPTPSTPKPNPSTPNTPVISENMLDVTSSNIEAVLKESHRRPVVLDFGASWCGPCKQLKPIIKKHNAAGNGKWLLGMIDTDANSALSRKYGVKLLPTVAAFKNGQELRSPARFEGAKSDAAMGEWIAALFR